MPKARLLKDWFDGRERHAKGSVVTVSEEKLAYDEKKTAGNTLRKPLFERLAEPAEAPAKAAAKAAAPKAAPVPVKPAPASNIA